MNMRKMLLIALLALSASATSMPTMGKVLGFGTAAYAQDQGADSQIDSPAVDEDLDHQ